MLFGATLFAIFVTHPHVDHYNLLSDIIKHQQITIANSEKDNHDAIANANITQMETACQLLNTKGFTMYLGGYFQGYTNNGYYFSTMVNFSQNIIQGLNDNDPQNLWRYLPDGEYKIGNIAISAHNILQNGATKEEDINTFGSIICISCNNRKVSFLGDMDFESYKYT